MELRVALFFLFLYYIRPQDWIEGLAGFNIIRPVIVAWALALFNARERSPVTNWFKTPHDWLMLAYFGFVVWNGADFKDTFMGFLPLVIFYFFTVQSITSWERLLTYLKAWNWMLIGVAGIAVSSLFGFDLTNAVEMTALNKGRLSIGTWIHNNPNALGHSVIVVIPLSYLLYFFRGKVVGMFFVFPAMAVLAGYCAMKTESKGAYVAGGLLVVALFVIGRPLAVKILAMAVAATAGFSALSFLPRMNEMGNLRSDEGVQGRLLAWEQAKMALENYPGGMGWKQFTAMIRWEGSLIPKATHSSYVQIGAELGLYGLALFIALLWTAFRSGTKAVRFTFVDPSRERCRRAVLLLVLSYVLSSWMINREYHTEYFLIIAIAAALHRLCLREESLEINEAEERNSLEEPDEIIHPAPTVSLGIRQEGTRVMPQLSVSNEWGAASADNELTPTFWNRIGVLDLALCAGLTWSVLYIWDYILINL